ncbi:poly-gamma-glutamate biosynthesis protein [Actinophytocola xinjiangensis]|uniref:Poly-gamma-glutamate biosynthesis protein n=2 Tax=Actinophytocola xinjiangensis TaxID=485602 RepID=A0A7Z1AWV6_9PSEU|nr:poly-gamma-glutamate biosynthesis protein [Actinophytocola xinjiangensis]
MRRSMLVVGGVALLVAGCGGDPAGGPPDHVTPLTSQVSAAGAEPAGDVFTVVASGDVLIHPALTEQAVADGQGGRDFGPLFSGVRDVIEAADLAICHLEVPLAGPDGPFEGYPLFSAPPEVATALADTGYDTCSTASNHTLDQGPEGVTSTIETLTAAGIAQTGAARTAAEAAETLVTDVGAAKVGQVSFTFGLNSGTSEPEPWMANDLDVDAVLDAARATKEAGADVVVASLHWGVEDQHEPTDEQRRIAGEVLADPAVDLIVGHHAHVVQPFEKINGKWVAYGLGNQVAKHAEPRGTTEEGVTARFRFAKGPDGWTVDLAEYVPTLVNLGPPIRLVDLTGEDTEVPADRLAEALARTDEVVASLGAVEDGLTRPGL